MTSECWKWRGAGLNTRRSRLAMRWNLFKDGNAAPEGRLMSFQELARELARELAAVVRPAWHGFGRATRDVIG